MKKAADGTSRFGVLVALTVQRRRHRPSTVPGEPTVPGVRIMRMLIRALTFVD